MPKFALLLTARYPSEKAYSVTTKETARAANDAGYQTIIYAPTASNQSDVINISNVPIKILTELLGRTPPIIDKVLFSVRRILIAIKFSSFIKESDDSLIVWTRDPLAGIFIPKNLQLVLELHNTPSEIDLVCCKVLNRRKNFLICTLTNSHTKRINKFFTNHHIVVAPMAVNKDFFITQNESQFREKIAFLGKGWSSGYDNQLGCIIQELATYKREHKVELKFTFLGIEEKYQTQLEQEIQKFNLKKENIEFITHVPHEQVPSYLKEIGIGLIPYQETKYNNQRFPIKALEYAAAGVSILATNTKINREILSDEFCYFYNPTIGGDLSSALKVIMDDSWGRQVKAEKARDWASKHSYLNRINVVLDSLSELKRDDVP